VFRLRPDLTVQLKEGRFDDVLEAIHSIWAPSQAHSIVVDFLPPHAEEVASNRRFFYGKALQSEREDHSGAYSYFPLPDVVFSDCLGYESCSPNKLSSDILVSVPISYADPERVLISSLPEESSVDQNEKGSPDEHGSFRSGA
jgi:hypothetical protein